MHERWSDLSTRASAASAASVVPCRALSRYRCSRSSGDRSGAISDPGEWWGRGCDVITMLLCVVAGAVDVPLAQPRAQQAVGLDLEPAGPGQSDAQRVVVDRARVLPCHAVFEIAGRDKPPDRVLRETVLVHHHQMPLAPEYPQARVPDAVGDEHRVDNWRQRIVVAGDHEDRVRNL